MFAGRFPTSDQLLASNSTGKRDNIGSPSVSCRVAEMAEGSVSVSLALRGSQPGRSRHSACFGDLIGKMPMPQRLLYLHIIERRIDGVAGERGIAKGQSAQ